MHRRCATGIDDEGRLEAVPLGEQADEGEQDGDEADEGARRPARGGPRRGMCRRDDGGGSLLDVIKAYIALTKPRVIELLLIAAVPAIDPKELAQVLTLNVSAPAALIAAFDPMLRRSAGARGRCVARA